MSKHENNLPLCDLAEESQPLGMNVDATAEDDAGSGDRVIVPGNVIASITCYYALRAYTRKGAPTLSVRTKFA